MAVVMYLFLLLGFAMIASHRPTTDDDGNVIRGRSLYQKPKESWWSTMLCAILGAVILLVVIGGPVYAMAVYEAHPRPPAKVDNDRWRLEYAALHGGEDPFSVGDDSAKRSVAGNDTWWATAVCGGVMCLLLGTGLVMNDDGERG